VQVEKITRFVIRNPSLVLVALLVVTIVFARFLPSITFNSDLTEMVPANDPVIRELEEAVADFGSQDMLMVIIESENVFTPQTLATIDRLTSQLRDLPGIDTVISPLDMQVIKGSVIGVEILPVAETLPDTDAAVEEFKHRVMQSPGATSLVAASGQAMAIAITFKPDIGDSGVSTHDLVREIEGIVRQEQGDDRAYIVGESYIGYYARQGMQRDLRILSPLVVFMVLLTLYLSFRTRWGVLLPILTVLISLTWTVGLMAMLGYSLSIVSIIIPIMLVAMGAAAGIHILNRYYEEIETAETNNDAVLATMQDINAPVLMTSLTTAAGFGALLTSFVQPVREFGLFTAIGILFAMVVALLAIPAILVLCPETRNRLPGKGNRETSWVVQLLRRAARRIAVGPVTVIVACVAIIIIFAAGIPRLVVETNFLEYFHEDSPVVEGTRLVEEYFGGTTSISVVVDTGQPDGIKDPEVLRQLLRQQEYLESLDHITYSTSIAELICQLNQALNEGDKAHYRIPDTPQAVAQELLLFTMQGGSGIESLISYDFSKAIVSARMANLSSSQVKRIIDKVDRAVESMYAGSGLDVSIVGLPKVMVRLMDRFMLSQWSSLTWSVVCVAAIVSLLMGSLIAGLLCIMPLVVTVVVNFGLMGYLGIPLDVATTMISSITIGIGVDYSIHYLSRYRSELGHGLSKQDALQISSTSTGKGIFFNALTLMLGFGILVFSTFKAIAVFGMLVSLTMLVAATCALTLLPAILALTQERVAISNYRGIMARLTR